MSDTCDAKIRPLPDDTELQCGSEVGHEHGHRAVLRDYAYPGSATTVEWQEDDRRTFRGEWAHCFEPDCILPNDHHGRHAS